MQSKFDTVPVDEDTHIMFQVEASLGERDALYQKWVWDGITGESLIFLSSDVSTLSDEELIGEVQSSPLVDEESELTLKRSESDYTFVNFNFSLG